MHANREETSWLEVRYQAMHCEQKPNLTVIGHPFRGESAANRTASQKQYPGQEWKVKSKQSPQGKPVDNQVARIHRI